MDSEKVKDTEYWSGVMDGFLFGFSIGTIGTILIILVTRSSWLPYVQ